MGGILRWTDGESGCSSSIADKREMPEADWRNQTSSPTSLSPAGDNYILTPTQVYLKLEEGKKTGGTKFYWMTFVQEICLFGNPAHCCSSVWAVPSSIGGAANLADPQ